MWDKSRMLVLIKEYFTHGFVVIWRGKPRLFCEE